MIWTVIACAALGAVLGLLMSSGAFLEGWQGDSDGEPGPDSGRAEAPEEDGPQVRELVLGRWLPSRALPVLGGLIGALAGVVSSLVVPVLWLAVIAGALVTGIAVMLVAPLCIGEVRHGLVEEEQDDPAEEEGDQ